VAGLALGIASLVVLVAPPVSVLVPVGAMIVSVAALVRLRGDPSLAGAGLAHSGLVLAVFSLAAGPTHWLVREWQLRSTAEHIGEQFVARLLAGDIRTAHQMTLEPSRRFATDRPLDESYRESATARDALAKFSDDPLVKELQSRHGAKITRVAVEWHETRSHVEQFGVFVEPAPGFEVRLLVEQRRAESTADWVVTSYSLKQ
jgi:hypothetical protein